MTLPSLSSEVEPWTLDTVAEVIGRVSFRNCADELEMQKRIGAALTAEGIEHMREAPIRGGRIDFRIGNIGVECKVKGSLSALTRQVSAYTDEPGISEFLVVTTRFALRRLPASMAGKAIRVLWVGGSSL